MRTEYLVKNKVVKTGEVIHKKTGNHYVVIGYVINKTNGENDSTVMIMYVRDSPFSHKYVREYSEFMEKFDYVD